MSEYGPTYNEIDSYIEDLTEAERDELAKADTAIELAFLFHDAREARGLTQAEAAQQAGLRQQAVSRFEQPDMKLANTKIDTLRKYMAALDYVVQIAVKDAKSGALIKKVSLSSWPDVDVAAVRPVTRFVEEPTTIEVVARQDSATGTSDLRAALESFSRCQEFTFGNVSPRDDSNDISFTLPESPSAFSAFLAACSDRVADRHETTAQRARSLSGQRLEATAKPQDEKRSATSQQGPQEKFVAA